MSQCAGQTITGPLLQTGPCTYVGHLQVPEAGRWFTYVSFEHDGVPLEAWIPVDSTTPSTQPATRSLYIAKRSGSGASATQIVSGTAIYTVGTILLLVGLLAVRRATDRTRRSGRVSVAPPAAPDRH